MKSIQLLENMENLKEFSCGCCIHGAGNAHGGDIGDYRLTFQVYD